MMRALAGIAALFTATVANFATVEARADVASYYWTGTKTANGERFNPLGMTAAHRTLPFGTMLRVTYQDRTVTVRINDRGPFIKGRTIDLSLGAARAIGLTARGVAPVTIERLN